MGGMSQLESDRQKSEFKTGDSRVIIMTFKSGGEGLHLTEAGRELMLDIIWHPSGNKQMRDRFWRDGQTGEGLEMAIIKAVDSIEDHVFEIAMSKK